MRAMVSKGALNSLDPKVQMHSDHLSNGSQHMNAFPHIDRILGPI